MVFDKCQYRLLPAKIRPVPAENRGSTQSFFRIFDILCAVYKVSGGKIKLLVDYLPRVYPDRWARAAGAIELKMDAWIEIPDNSVTARIIGCEMRSWQTWKSAVGPQDVVFNIFQADSYSPDGIRRFSEKRIKTKSGLSQAAVYVEIDHFIQHKGVVEIYPENQPFAVIIKRFWIKFA
jgi:hypothetical protein